MTLLVRKLNRNRWLKTDDNHDIFKVKSDAITNCLKSTRNTLSFWEITDIKDLEEAVLAIIANSQHIESIDVVILEKKYLEDKDIKFDKTKGVTLVEDLEETHIDVCELNYYSLGIVAEYISERVNDSEVKRFTVIKLIDIFNKAINSNRLDVNKLSESIRKKL